MGGRARKNGSGSSQGLLGLSVVEGDREINDKSYLCFIQSKATGSLARALA